MLDERGDQRFELVGDEALFAVHRKPGIEPCGTDRAHPLDIQREVAGQLGLDRPRIGMAGGDPSHRLRRVGAEREGGDAGPWFGKARQLPYEVRSATRMERGFSSVLISGDAVSLHKKTPSETAQPIAA